jgi:hypothetical protein
VIDAFAGGQASACLQLFKVMATCSGFTMVLPWFYHGFTMVLPWFYDFILSQFGLAFPKP